MEVDAYACVCGRGCPWREATPPLLRYAGGGAARLWMNAMCVYMCACLCVFTCGCEWCAWVGYLLRPHRGCQGMQEGSAVGKYLIT